MPAMVRGALLVVEGDVALAGAEGRQRRALLGEDLGRAVVGVHGDQGLASGPVGYDAAVGRRGVAGLQMIGHINGS